MDASSELVHALLPLYLVGVLGASAVAVGVLEGIAESTAQFVKLYSGWLSDRMRSRKWLIVLGYGLAALSKPLFPLAESVAAVFAARFADRIGKGIRGAPRDALIADVTPPEQRGAAYGLRQALDSVGAVLGPLAAVALLAVFSGNLRTALWFAVIPAALAVLVLIVGVEERAATQSSRPRPAPVQWADVRAMPAGFWGICVLGVVFTLARFSEAFLILRATDVGFSTAMAPVVMVVMSLVYAAASFPAGAASDRIGARGLLLAGLGALVAADALIAFWPRPVGLLLGTALWGLHMGLTQGLLSRLVADHAPTALRGSAFGLFNLATGVAMLLASVLAGLLWTYAGPASPFVAGGLAAVAAMLGIAVATGRGEPPGTVGSPR